MKKIVVLIILIGFISCEKAGIEDVEFIEEETVIDIVNTKWSMSRMEDFEYNGKVLNTLCTRVVTFDTDTKGELSKIVELNIQVGNFIVEQAITSKQFFYKIKNNIIYIEGHPSAEYIGTIKDDVLELKGDEEVYSLIKQ